ncbi:hypothetical protein [Flavobacterium sp. HJJ]|uniref:hypothetical protein n=1 Tax=Flavobacterium sp. HJJ TaxID=2783792 RepID=UPI00188C6F70|nr:hypothetical protein [Flavobacterium sp. HJJ]MBF4473199.1 hypothetical protein [Flavobacterium sp. HJJ]
MNEITFEEYKKAIKSQFEQKKIEGIYGSGDISNITPAQLRDLCLYIAQRGMTKADEATFRFFFNVNENEKFERTIENFNTGKLKSVISFLKEDKKSENRPRIELAAVIVDFNPRPFKRFSQNTGAIEIADENFPENEYEEVDIVPKKNIEVVTKKEGIITDNGTKKKIMTIVIVLLSLFFTGYTAKNIFFPAKQCMQWQGSHYEEVDCLNDPSGNEIIPIDLSIINLKKLDSKGEQVFFKNGKPVVWYSKEHGKIELFNQPGLHPETGKTLKEITKYIIKEHHLKEKE